MVLYHTVRLTAAAQIDLPRAGLYLVRAVVRAGATPGSYSWNLDGVHTAHLLCTSNGTRGRATYRLNHKVEGQTVAAGSMGFNGGVNEVSLVFSDTPNATGKAMSEFRAVRVARTDGGGLTANMVFNFPGAATRPRFVHGCVTANNARGAFPQVGSLTYSHEATVQETPDSAEACPDLPEAASLTLSVTTDAASTVQFVVFY